MLKLTNNIGSDQREEIINFLNQALETDRKAISALVETRVPCNQEMLNHPTIQVMVENEQPTVGFLGLLNGIIGINKNGFGYITAEVEDDGTITKFMNT